MRRERLFSEGGFYGFLIDSNVLLHREAVQRGARILERYVAQRADDAPIRVLDLACGGEPVSLAQMLASVSGRTYRYTGIDINPDQVQAAEEFAFPSNVESARLLEGNAWDLRGLPAHAFDVVFMGMNLHHGTPEEVWFLARELGRVVTQGGVFFDHDWFRPDEQWYARRPDADPDAPGDSLHMIDPALLTGVDANALGLDEAKGQSDAEWRLAYIRRLRDALLARGAHRQGAEATARHVYRRDFPISVAEFRRIFEGQGFDVEALGYADSSEPLAEYTKMVVAWQASHR